MQQTALNKLIDQLMYFRQINDDDQSYVAAINDIIKIIDNEYLTIERKQIEKAFEKGCTIYANFECIEIKGAFYFDKVYR